MGVNLDTAFNRMIDEIKLTPPLDESRIMIVKKKLDLLEYIKSYKFQGKEELRFYLQDYVLDDKTMQEEIDMYNEMSADELVAHLLLFEEFKEKLQKHVKQFVNYNDKRTR